MLQSELHLGPVHGSVVKLPRDLGLQSSLFPHPDTSGHRADVFSVSSLTLRLISNSVPSYKASGLSKIIFRF